MNAFDIFKLWSALRLHFQSDTYDYHQYNGKTKTSQKTFDNHWNKGVFYKLSRKYDDKVILDYFLANFLYEEKVQENMLMTIESEQNYKRFIKRKQSLFNVFSDDMQTLMDLCEVNNRTFAELFVIHKNALYYTQLKVYLDFGEITLETFIILDILLNFTENWNKIITEDPFYIDFIKRCNKFKPFLAKSINKTKYRLHLKKILGTTTTL